MKDIDKMNVAELAEIMAPYSDLKERIINRLRVIHEETRWIPVSERMPTAEDAHNGQVLVKEENWTTDHAYSIAYYKNIEPDVPERQPSEWYVTYWKRITPPEGV